MQRFAFKVQQVDYSPATIRKVLKKEKALQDARFGGGLEFGGYSGGESEDDQPRSRGTHIDFMQAFQASELAWYARFESVMCRKTLAQTHRFHEFHAVMQPRYGCRVADALGIREITPPSSTNCSTRCGSSSTDNVPLCLGRLVLAGSCWFWLVLAGSG